MWTYADKGFVPMDVVRIRIVILLVYGSPFSIKEAGALPIKSMRRFVLEDFHTVGCSWEVVGTERGVFLVFVSRPLSTSGHSSSSRASTHFRDGQRPSLSLFSIQRIYQGRLYFV